MKLIAFMYTIFPLIGLSLWFYMLYYEKTLLKKEREDVPNMHSKIRNFKIDKELMRTEKHKATPDWTCSTYSSEQRKKLFKK